MKRLPISLIYQTFKPDQRVKLVHAARPEDRFPIIQENLDRINFITMTENNPKEIYDELNKLIWIHGEKLL